MKLGDLARREGVSINQLVNSAVAAKMAALMTVEYLQEQAKSGTRRQFEAVLAKVPNSDSEGFDRLPDKRLERTSRKARRSASKR
jgi:hypothetical protein